MGIFDGVADIDDLQATRNSWLKEVENDPAEHAQRLESDFLKAESSDGQRADFHAFRHLFVSMLASTGVHPKTAQMLARHSTITLTMDLDSHVRIADLSQAVSSIPPLTTTPEHADVIQFAGTNIDVPCCPPCYPAADFSCQSLTTIDESEAAESCGASFRNSLSGMAISDETQSFMQDSEMNRTQRCSNSD